MTIENLQTFDMGEFSLDASNTSKTSDDLLPKDFTGMGTKDTEKMEKTVANQTFKEVMKTTKKMMKKRVTNKRI